MKKTLLIFCAVPAILITSKTIAQTNCDPEEVDGLLVFEAERFELKGAWKLGEDADKASGGKYIYFDGANSYQNVNSANNISYTFKINNPGTYNLKWTMRQPAEEAGGDLGNDAWVYFSDDVGRANNEILTNFVKFVGRSDTNGNFTLNGAADINHTSYQIFVVFPSAGNYTMNMSGRSHGFQVDRIILNKDVSAADLPAKIALIAETNTCDSGDDNPTGEEVSIANPFTTFADHKTQMDLTINFETIAIRQIKVDLTETNGTVIKSASSTVSAGTGSTDITLNLDSPLLWSTAYLLKTSIYNEDGDTKIREVLNSFSATVDKTLNTIEFVEIPDPIYQVPTVIKIRYTASKSRDVFVQLRRNNWNAGTVRVNNLPAGTHTRDFTLNMSNLPGNGNNYYVRAMIRVNGTPWAGNINLIQEDNVVVNSNYTPLSVDSFDIKNNVTVYPNPFSDELNLKLDGAHDYKTIDIINLQGKLIRSFNVDGIENLKLNLDVAKGMYFLKAKGQNVSKVLKLIKK